MIAGHGAVPARCLPASPGLANCTSCACLGSPSTFHREFTFLTLPGLHLVLHLAFGGLITTFYFDYSFAVLSRPFSVVAACPPFLGVVFALSCFSDRGIRDRPSEHDFCRNGIQPPSRRPVGRLDCFLDRSSPSGLYTFYGSMIALDNPIAPWLVRRPEQLSDRPIVTQVLHLFGQESPPVIHQECSRCTVPLKHFTEACRHLRLVLVVLLLPHRKTAGATIQDGHELLLPDMRHVRMPIGPKPVQLSRTPSAF